MSNVANGEEPFGHVGARLRVCGKFLSGSPYAGAGGSVVTTREPDNEHRSYEASRRHSSMISPLALQPEPSWLSKSCFSVTNQNFPGVLELKIQSKCR